MKITPNLFLFFLICFCADVSGQQLKTRNVIIVTLDGYRWNELFEGADNRIISNPVYVKDTVVNRFASGTRSVRRQKLMPFVWDVVAREGQLYGNRKVKNRVNCFNNHLLSYPGYSEMFVGYPQRGVSSNDKENNPKPTVLEHIHKHRGFHKKIAAFGTWDVFPYIFREQHSDIYVNAGNDIAIGDLSRKEQMLNEHVLAGGRRNDELTFQFAFEYIKREKPRVVFIGFDGTDHHAHGGRYDEYLKSANRIDTMISELWKWVQSTPGFRDETTLFITTDHGRGSGKNNWKDHRLAAPGSRHIWFAVIGPDTPSFGEMKFKGKYYQKQVAKTVAAFLGINYDPDHRTGEIVQTMIASPQPLASREPLHRSREESPND